MTNWNSWGPLPVRIGVGVIMLVHGFGKLFGVGPGALPIPQFTEFLAGLGVPVPALVAWGITLIEVIGGLCILLGLFTRVAAVALAADMLAATLLVHLPEGFSDAELTILLCLASVSLFVSGPGRLALHEIGSDDQRRSLSAITE